MFIVRLAGRKISRRIYCLSVALFLMLSISMTAFAEKQLDAGKIIGGLQERRTTLPEQANVKIDMAEEQTGHMRPSQGAKIKVGNIRITGQSIYREEMLLGLVKDALGRELTLTELEGLAERVTTYLHDKGYLVAIAYIPEQEVKDGTVEIRVVIGQYDRITLYNHSKLSRDVASCLLNNIKAGDYVKNDLLERTLLLLNDGGGVSSKGTLVPGRKQGTTDLIVELVDALNKNGQVSIDNYGNRFTGQNRANISLAINNLPSGDSASISCSTAGRNFNDVDWGYSMLLGSDGTRLSMDYYQMHYRLGKQFASLNATGEAKIVNFYTTYPIVRSRNDNLYARIGYEHKSFQDIHASQNVAVRNNQTNAGSIGLSGDSRDKFGGGGANSFELNYYDGHIDTNDRTTSIPGSYTKTVLNYNRLQYIHNRLNLLVGFTGQVANKSLDSTEKIFISGINGIKAYPQGAVYGDRGYLLTGEFRWNMPTPTCQLAFYYEQGRVINRQNPTDARGNDCTLSGAGVGLIYNDRKSCSLRLDYAWPVNSTNVPFSEKGGRFWLRGSMYF